jgi:hypothetical protein
LFSCFSHSYRLKLTKLLPQTARSLQESEVGLYSAEKRGVGRGVELLDGVREEEEKFGADGAESLCEAPEAPTENERDVVADVGGGGHEEKQARFSVLHSANPARRATAFIIVFSSLLQTRSRHVFSLTITFREETQQKAGEKVTFRYSANMSQVEDTLWVSAYLRRREKN